MSKINKKFALISVFNKKGVARFAKTLLDLGFEIISTKGTGKELESKGASFLEAEKISKNPKGLENCIKTISFHIEAGILFNRDNPAQARKIEKLDIRPIDMVVCNFPPIKEVVKRPTDFNISNVDVGGPLMVRAAAVNFKQTIIIVDLEDYDKIINAIMKNNVSDELRQWLAIKAFNYCSIYDKKIIKYLRSVNLT